MDGHWTVPRDWAGQVAVCLATGPSLCVDDVVQVLRRRAEAPREPGLRVIAVNDAWRLAPWADVLYAADLPWWNLYHEAVAEGFQGLRVGIVNDAKRVHPPGVRVLRKAGAIGLTDDPGALCTGSNSGYQAIHLAVHFGATHILLLGYDMQPAPDGTRHYFGEHPKPLGQRSNYDQFRKTMATLVPPLKQRGVRVWNCSRSTALQCFPRVPLEQAMAELSAREEGAA